MSAEGLPPRAVVVAPGSPFSPRSVLVVFRGENSEPLLGWLVSMVVKRVADFTLVVRLGELKYPSPYKALVYHDGKEVRAVEQPDALFEIQTDTGLELLFDVGEAGSGDAEAGNLVIG